MEIRYLKLIKAIVEEGGITKAISKLHLTQSALSYQLKEAETQIGTAIFYRRNKKLLLTPIGEKLYNTAKIVLSEIEQTESEIQRMVSGETGTIRLSTECYTSYHWLPPVLKKFKQEFPKVDVQIIYEATHKPVEKILDGALDLAITSNPVHQDKIDYHQLFVDEMLAMVSSDHIWADKSYVDPQDFSKENLIIHSLPLETVSVYRVMLSPLGISPRKLTVLPLTEASIELVKANMGVIVMANWALEPYKSDDIKTIKITSQGFYRQQYMASNKQSDQPLYFSYFKKFLREEMNFTLEEPAQKLLKRS